MLLFSLSLSSTHILCSLLFGYYQGVLYIITHFNSIHLSGYALPLIILLSIGYIMQVFLPLLFTMNWLSFRHLSCSKLGMPPFFRMWEWQQNFQIFFSNCISFVVCVCFRNHELKTSEVTQYLQSIVAAPPTNFWDGKFIFTTHWSDLSFRPGQYEKKKTKERGWVAFNTPRTRTDPWTPRPETAGCPPSHYACVSVGDSHWLLTVSPRDGCSLDLGIFPLTCSVLLVGEWSTRTGR